MRPSHRKIQTHGPRTPRPGLQRLFASFEGHAAARADESLP